MTPLAALPPITATAPTSPAATAAEGGRFASMLGTAGNEPAAASGKRLPEAKGEAGETPKTRSDPHRTGRHVAADGAEVLPGIADARGEQLPAEDEPADDTDAPAPAGPDTLVPSPLPLLALAPAPVSTPPLASAQAGSAPGLVVGTQGIVQAVGTGTAPDGTQLPVTPGQGGEVLPTQSGVRLEAVTAPTPTAAPAQPDGTVAGEAKPRLPLAEAETQPSQPPVLSSTTAPLDTAALLARRPVTTRGTTARVLAAAEPTSAPLTAPIATPAPVAATASAQQAPLDLTQHGWPTAMIDRIERLRDAADAVSTSIRVIPDALGAIDVSVRKDGEVTHVHLAAEQAQTRALLADAQPKLAEIAEQRGLRLGQTDVGGGAGSAAGGQQQQAPAQQPQVAARPRPASPASAVRTLPDDIRIA